MIIVLVGYMGSGKSSVGKALAKTLSYGFIDLDSYIEEKEGANINQIFRSKGEIYFRRKESQYLKEVIANGNNIVLGLGGGTPCYSGNMDFLKQSQSVVSVYLNLSIVDLAARLENEKDKRPLISHIKTKELLTEFIGKHLFERLEFYNKADLTIAIKDQTINEIVKEIVLKLF